MIYCLYIFLILLIVSEKIFYKSLKTYLSCLKGFSVLLRFRAIQGVNGTRYCQELKVSFVVFADICWYHLELSLIKSEGGSEVEVGEGRGHVTLLLPGDCQRQCEPLLWRCAARDGRSRVTAGSCGASRDSNSTCDTWI